VPEATVTSNRSAGAPSGPAVPAWRFSPDEVAAFTYDRFELDLAAGRLSCHYLLDDLPFVEQVQLPPARRGVEPAAADRAARLVFLLAGVSYYKAAAPPVVDLGRYALTPDEAAMLHAFYVDGLGEYAYRNELDLTALELRYEHADPSPIETGVSPTRPLVPFGGGIDSIVSVETVRAHHPDTALFVVSRLGDRFTAIEDAAAVTGLPVVRAGRELDPRILRSRELGFRNGHIPVTGIISAIAVLAAVLDGRGQVVMSNEWSASAGNVEHHGRTVNHQYSKSLAFEDLLRAALANAFRDGPDWFSLLRPFSELAIARRFADLRAYHPVFRSCNRAFHLDASARQATWCGTCDKCCFIDLILSPFVPAADLRTVFGGREPLGNPETLPVLRTLLDVGDGPKPFECVGDVTECRAAVQLAAARPDRAGEPVLEQLAAAVGPHAVGHAELAALLSPIGRHHLPDAYATRDLLG
jgi:hypothetical protein